MSENLFLFLFFIAECKNVFLFTFLACRLTLEEFSFLNQIMVYFLIMNSLSQTRRHFNNELRFDSKSLYSLKLCDCVFDSTKDSSFTALFCTKGRCWKSRCPKQWRQRAGAQHQSCHDEDEEGRGRLGHRWRRRYAEHRLGQLRTPTRCRLLASLMWDPAFGAARFSPQSCFLTRLGLRLHRHEYCSLSKVSHCNPQSSPETPLLIHNAFQPRKLQSHGFIFYKTLSGLQNPQTEWQDERIFFRCSVKKNAHFSDFCLFNEAQLEVPNTTHSFISLFHCGCHKILTLVWTDCKNEMFYCYIKGMWRLKDHCRRCCPCFLFRQKQKKMHRTNTIRKGKSQLYYICNKWIYNKMFVTFFWFHS